MFENELRDHLNERAQVVTSAETISGVLVAVTESTATVRVAQYPGYGGAEDVTVRLETIAYVRFFV
ncbi:hypothetical protein [Paenibacillus sp.]|uniref:hypothetical protein n=1 Tax=Paenibacillus sp. TaxID=58172 RepID=UPI002D2C00E7|nr:hypothetical protein [Paenibacillus sp.]HZG58284.1 hypothetical protein [Paenibacillus sp.]